MMNHWQKLSARERMLAVTVAVLLLAGIVSLLGYRAVLRVQDLDEAIAQRQESLINYTELLARSQSVDEAYAQVAAQHSSRWSGPEIHDRLRNEIYRLAMTDPPPEGTPFSPNQGENLVSIPTLQQGSLKKGGEGYREYLLALRLPAAPVANMITFLERLQASDQSLRIDQLQLSRAPDAPVVTALLEVTRTVVDGAPVLPDAPPPVAAFSSATVASGVSADDWEKAGCEVSQVADHATLGPDCVKAVAKRSGATLWLNQSLDQGKPYDLYLDLTASGAGSIGIVRSRDDLSYAGEEALVGDGKTRQYRLRFIAPNDAECEVKAPFITLTDEGAEVFVDNVLLKKAGA